MISAQKHVLVVGACLAGGCNTRGSVVDSVRAPSKVSVDGATLEPVAVRGIVFDLQRGTRVGGEQAGWIQLQDHPHVWSDDWAARLGGLHQDVAAILKNCGFRMIGPGPGTVDEDARAKARIQLSAVVSKLRVDTVKRPEETRSDALVECTWKLYDSRRDTVVCEFKSVGAAQAWAPLDVNLSVIRAALQNATQDLAAQPGFVKQLSFSEVTDNSVLRLSVPGPLRQGGDIVLSPDADSFVRVEAAGQVGRGFFISPDGYLLTSARLLGLDAQVQVSLSSGLTFPAEFIRADVDRDVALLRVPWAGFHALPIQIDGGLKVGDPVQLVAGVGQGFEAVSGTVQAVPGDPSPDRLKTTIALDAGAIGSALVDHSGNAIGIVTSQSADRAAPLGASAVAMSAVLRALRIELAPKS